MTMHAPFGTNVECKISLEGQESFRFHLLVRIRAGWHVGQSRPFRSALVKCQKTLRQLHICGSAARTRTVSVTRFPPKSRDLPAQKPVGSFQTDIATRIRSPLPASVVSGARFPDA